VAGGRQLDLVIPIPPVVPPPNVVRTDVADFVVPPTFSWSQLATRREAIDLDQPMPLTMMVIRVDPDDFFTNADVQGNVALTAALVEGRVNIVATNLSDIRLNRLTVRWWALRE
jgi:hypothetical protein